MECDLNLLLDVLEFLQTLKNVPLPTMYETSRERLLGRVQVVLSPGDNYIDMKPGKLLPNPSVTNQIVVEDNILSHSPTGPSFLYNYQSKLSESPKKLPALKPPEPSPIVAPAPVVVTCEDVIVDREEKKQADDKKIEKSLMEVYLTMSLTQAQEKSYKSGELRRREKRFIFESIRPFWAAVLGSHFLSYDGKADTKPSQVFPLKRSTCRPAFPVHRSVKKFSDSTFDICLEDCRVFQFIAQTPEEMEQWLEAIERSQNKAYTKKVDQPSSNISPEVKQSESLVEERSSGEVYDTIIPDIVGALGIAPKASALPGGPQIPTTVQLQVPGAKLPKETQKTLPPIHPLPPKPSKAVLPKRILRDLPLPPVATQLDDETDTIYNEIENPQAKKLEFQSVIPHGKNEAEEDIEEEEADNDETYDDVATVRQQIRLLGLTSERGTVKETPVQHSVDEALETYDDVEAVKIEVQILREAEATAATAAAAAAKSEACEKEKRTLKVPPKIPTRVSPIKCLFGRMRQRSESPQKEIEQKKHVADVTAERQCETSPEIKGDRKPAESSCGYMKKQLLDHSDYNIPRTPKPVHVGKPPEKVMEDDEEEIYDDILEGTNLGNRMISRDSEAGKQKKNDVLLTKYTSIPDGVNGRSVGGAKKAVKNLAISFKDEIYENHPRDKSVQGYSELDQTQSFTDLNPHPAVAIAAEHVDEEEDLYDDVQIVAQKNRAIEESKKNLILKTPPKNIRNLFAARNLFPVKRTAIEKISPHDNDYKDDEDIYDDCAPK